MNKRLVFNISIAAILWFFLFSPWTAPKINFWALMSGSALILAGLSLLSNRDFSRQFHFSPASFLIGITSAALLWFIFFFADFLSSLLFDFARVQVESIYSMKEGSNLTTTALLLLLLIGPAEEIFWRGYVQTQIAKRHGPWCGFLIAALIYCLVHIWSFNFMLIMAALVCGLFWGLLWRWKSNLTINILSHALWDVAVFIIWPI